MATFYKLSDKYILRGWDKLPYAIVNDSTKVPKFLTEDQMRVISRCNGEWDFDSILTLDEDRECVKKFMSEGFIEQCREGEGISPRQEYLFYPNRYVSFVHFGITGKCNYKCKHCFMSAPEGKLGELSYASIMNIIEQLDECGVMDVLLTGGEPLIRPDFPEIVKEISRRKMSIKQLYTNGALLNDKVLDCLQENGHNPTVIMSFDGVGWHDWLRGVPGAEKAVNDAFLLCKRRGVQTHSQVIFHRKNLHTMRETVNYLASVGCGSVCFGIVNEKGEWLKNKEDNTVSMQEYMKAALEYIPHYYEDGMPINIIIGGLFAASPRDPDSYSAVPVQSEGGNPKKLLFNCSRHKLQILPNGRVSICDNLNDEFLGYPPIVTDTPGQETMPLREILSSDSEYMRLMDKKQREFLEASPECAECKYLRFCGGGCRALSFKAYGSILRKDNEACNFFRNGWLDMLIETLRRVRPHVKPKVLNDNFFQS